MVCGTRTFYRWLLPEHRNGGGRSVGHLRTRLSASEQDQGAVRPDESVPVEHQHRTRGVKAAGGGRPYLCKLGARAGRTNSPHASNNRRSVPISSAAAAAS